MDALKIIAESSMKKELPSFSIGDTVKVGVRIREGKTERVQMFEGTVIAIKGSGISKTFTVRRVSYGVGVERVFPLHSANVDSVEVIRKGKAVLSFTIFAIVSARLQKLKKISDKVFDRLVLGRSFCFILCNFYERQCECYA